MKVAAYGDPLLYVLRGSVAHVLATDLPYAKHRGSAWERTESLYNKSKSSCHLCFPVKRKCIFCVFLNV